MDFPNLRDNQKTAKNVSMKPSVDLKMGEDESNN